MVLRSSPPLPSRPPVPSTQSLSVYLSIYLPYPLPPPPPPPPPVFLTLIQHLATVCFTRPNVGVPVFFKCPIGQIQSQLLCLIPCEVIAK